MTDDLSKWLLEQIAEDEANARTVPAVQHMVAWLPRRVLAECDAKRQIIEACRPFAVRDYSTDGEAVAWAVLVQLAAPFADRPGYQEAWRP